MEKEFKYVCTPDGWTVPCQSLREKDNAENMRVAEFDKRCRDQISNAEEVMNLIDSILNPKKTVVHHSPTISFVVNDQGFWLQDENNIPKLIHQDPSLQIDI